MTFVLRFAGDEKFIREAQAEEAAGAKAPEWEEARGIWGAERGPWRLPCKEPEENGPQEESAEALGLRGGFGTGLGRGGAGGEQ